MDIVEARVENAISRTLNAEGCFVPLSVRRAAAQAVVEAINGQADLDERDVTTGCCAKDGIDCPSCMTGRCSECLDCVHGPSYDNSARDDEDDAYYDEDED